MNTAERIYQSVKTLPEFQAEEVLNLQKMIIEWLESGVSKNRISDIICQAKEELIREKN